MQTQFNLNHILELQSKTQFNRKYHFWGFSNKLQKKKNPLPVKKQ